MNAGDVQVFEKTLDGKPLVATWVVCGGEPPLYVWTRIWADPALRGQGYYTRYLKALNDDIFNLLGEDGCGGGFFDFIGKGNHAAKAARAHAVIAVMDRDILCRSVTLAGTTGGVGPTMLMYGWPPLKADWTTVPDAIIDRMLACHDMSRYRG